MKKTLIAVAAAAALVSSAFAEVTFGGWGRQIWAPVANNGDDTVTAMLTSWGWNPRIGYGMDFKSENVDMHADFKLEEGTAAINDQCKATYRPVEGVALSIGKIQDDTLRGDACFGSWNWIRPNWISDEGITFSRTVDVTGVSAKITAVENLVVLAGLNVPADATGDAKAKLAENAYKNVAIGAGYTIDGIGQVKAQYFGTSEKGKSGKVEAAFKLTAVENLSAEVGFKMSMADDDWDATFTNCLTTKTIALGAHYQVNDVCGVSANAEMSLYPDLEVAGVKVSVDPTIKFGLGVDYALDNGIGLAADVRVNMPQNEVDPSIAFMLGASKGFSNGKLSVGFQGVSVAEDSGAGFAGNGSFDPAKDGLVWALPVCFEYWF